MVVIYTAEHKDIGEATREVALLANNGRYQVKCDIEHVTTFVVFNPSNYQWVVTLTVLYKAPH